MTRLLNACQSGDPQAVEHLLPLVYGELRQLAGAYFRRERSSHTLQPTALVHEAYLRLVDQRSLKWDNYGHFLSIAATVMRRILLDYARAHAAEKRGGGLQVTLNEDMAVSEQKTVETIALDAALTKLAQLDPHQAHIVELRFFGGLSVEQTAAVLKVSPPTVKRHWASAKAWLYRELAKGEPIGTGTVEANPARF